MSTHILILLIAGAFLLEAGWLAVRASGGLRARLAAAARNTATIAVMQFWAVVAALPTIIEGIATLLGDPAIAPAISAWVPALDPQTIVALVALSGYLARRRSSQ